LNRVSFLRPDHAFLSQALHHPSASFILFNKLEPLLSSPSNLHLAKYADVEPILGSDPFATSEADLIAQYNSTKYTPLIIFLGLDERKGKEGFVYKEHYKGQPYFALDVTPKESVTEAAETLIRDVEGRGLTFSKGRIHMSLEAQDGTSRHLLPVSFTDHNIQRPFTQRPAT
jgi:NAD+ diphosphatase